MEAAGARRLLVVSAAVLFERSGPRRQNPAPHAAEKCRRRFIEMERIVAASALDWTIVRPTRLTNGPRTGRYDGENSPIPKLFIAGDPGAMLIGPARDFCDIWPRQQKVTVSGIHYLQEDSPTEIGVAIARFIKDLPE
jgi:NAD(P)H-binding